MNQKIETPLTGSEALDILDKIKAVIEEVMNGAEYKSSSKVDLINRTVKTKVESAFIGTIELDLSFLIN